jgi:hypothetical protein
MVEGGMVCLIEGASAPLILRGFEQRFIGDGHTSAFQVQKTERLIGDAYVHSIMDGEEFNKNNVKDFIIS